MGRPDGFMHIVRQEQGHRTVEERIQDYDEFLLPADLAVLRDQGARCMDCGIPFCHTGKMIRGMAMGCPLGNLIPEINDLVYRGHMDKAYARLRKTNPFPEFTGRVCPAPCEGSCTLGEHESAVTVKQIECALSDYARQSGENRAAPPRNRIDKRVAVVGSGPAGLSCAHRLNQRGYAVTVFERADRVGGLLVYGIPNMKLNKQIVLDRVALMEKEGISFVVNAEIGVTHPVSDLMREYDAVVLCCGATAARMPDAPGAQLQGVMPALSFLTANTKKLLDAGHGTLPQINAKGKDVVIIGGGDTGTDCVATSLRQGCKSVTQLEIMDRLPEGRAADNPWPEWPKVCKTDYGQEEAVHVFGADPREYLTTVTEILGDGDGHVEAVKTVKVEWRTEKGRAVPRPVAGSESLRPAQLVLVAMGFVGPEQTLIRQLGLETDGRGNVATGGTDHQSSMGGVFAAGDMRRGQSLVVWALREGLEAADACHRYLKDQR